MAKPNGMMPRSPESPKGMQEDHDYREPWGQACSTETPSKPGLAATEFHFREAGVLRFNDIYDWDDDER